MKVTEGDCGTDLFNEARKMLEVRCGLKPWRPKGQGPGAPLHWKLTKEWTPPAGKMSAEESQPEHFWTPPEYSGHEKKIRQRGPEADQERERLLCFCYEQHLVRRRPKGAVFEDI